MTIPFHIILSLPPSPTHPLLFFSSHSFSFFSFSYRNRGDELILLACWSRLWKTPDFPGTISYQCHDKYIYIYLQYVMSNPILMSNNLLYSSLYLYCIKILTPQSEAVRFSITLKIVVVCKLRMVEWCTKPKHSPDADFLCRHFCHSNYTCNQHSGCVWYRVSTETAQTIWLSYLNIESKCNQLCH